jgi:hypothetical protein
MCSLQTDMKSNRVWTSSKPDRCPASIHCQPKFLSLCCPSRVVAEAVHYHRGASYVALFRQLMRIRTKLCGDAHGPPTRLPCHDRSTNCGVTQEFQGLYRCDKTKLQLLPKISFDCDWRKRAHQASLSDNRDIFIPTHKSNCVGGHANM